MIGDPGLPVLSTLLSDDVIEPLQAAVQLDGGRIRSARPTVIRYRPGTSVSIRYATEVEWPDGGVVVESLVALAGKTPPPGAVEVSDGESRLFVWRFPADPYLPGLPTASSGTEMRRLMDRLGVPPGDLDMRCLAYRPTRRAVLRVEAQGRVVFTKLVPAGELDELADTHRAYAAVEIVPDLIGRSVELGLVVLEARPGEQLRVPILGDRGRLPEPAAVLGCLDVLEHGTGVTRPARPGARASLPSSEAVLRAVAPWSADRVAQIVERVGEERPGATRMVHGDFYEAQVLVDAHGSITGLIDIDGVGLGQRSDDVANLLAHLTTLAVHAPASATRVTGYVDALLDAVDDDPAEVCRRAAALSVGMATGPFRAWEDGWERRTDDRLGLAEMWLDRADTLDAGHGRRRRLNALTGS